MIEGRVDEQVDEQVDDRVTTHFAVEELLNLELPHFILPSTHFLIATVEYTYCNKNLSSDRDRFCGNAVKFSHSTFLAPADL
jgi:hypothetical protein